MPQKISSKGWILDILLYLLSLNSWWFDGFPSHFKGFSIWRGLWYSGWEKKQQHKTMLCDTPLMQLDREWKWTGNNCIAKLIYPNRNGLVWYLAVSTPTLGPVHSRGWGEGMLAVKVCILIKFHFYSSSMWHVQHHVWHWYCDSVSERHCFACWSDTVTVSVSSHCFACWSTLEAILFSQSFHWLLGPGYRVSPASHTKHSVILNLYKGNIYQQAVPVKTRVYSSV